MRAKLNSNPVTQVVFIGLLLVAVGFVFMTRVMNRGPSSDSTETSGASSDPAAASAAVVPGAGSAPSVGTVAPEAGSAPSVGTVAPPAPTPVGSTGFTAGPGLPKDFVDAYKAGDVVALLVTEKHGSDDEAMRQTSRVLSSRSGVELFTIDARHIARYSRIAQGVDLDHTPALVVVQPKRLTNGAIPSATVSYGYRGPSSVLQAISDAGYSGKVHDYSP